MTTTTTNPELIRVFKNLEAIPAAGNNGYARLDCLTPTQARRLKQFKAELEARGNVVFTDVAVYTAESFAIVAKHSENVQRRMEMRADHARRQAEYKAQQQQRGDYALNAMLARAEAMMIDA